MGLLIQAGPVIQRCTLEGEPCPETDTPWLLIAGGAVLAVILIVAVIQGIRYRRGQRADD